MVGLGGFVGEELRASSGYLYGIVALEEMVSGRVVLEGTPGTAGSGEDGAVVVDGSVGWGGLDEARTISSI